MEQMAKPAQQTLVFVDPVFFFSGAMEHCRLLEKKWIRHLNRNSRTRQLLYPEDKTRLIISTGNHSGGLKK
jgi:hypothetical protein